MSPEPGRQLRPGAHEPVEQPPAASLEERDLVAAVLRKDRKAMAEFVDRYADPVHGYVRHRMLPRNDLVDDFVQDVFLAALEGLHRFAGDSSLRGWLLGIARHKIEDHYRARLREQVFDADIDGDTIIDDDIPVDQMIDGARLEARTREILGRLPESYGVVLLWRYWGECSTRQIAIRTGKSEKAIERLLARARAQFKQLWEGK